MRPIAPVAVVLLAVAAAGCGYALAGRGNALPDHIRRIGIPNFENQSSTPDLDRILSDAVRAEFSSRGRFQVVTDTTGVDAVLSGALKPIVMQVAALTDTRQASKYLISVHASVEFKDLRDNKVLFTNQNVRVNDEYEVTGSTVVNDPSAIFSQDANALTRLARTFARSLVASILEAF